MPCVGAERYPDFDDQTAKPTKGAKFFIVFLAFLACFAVKIVGQGFKNRFSQACIPSQKTVQ